MPKTGLQVNPARTGFVRNPEWYSSRKRAISKEVPGDYASVVGEYKGCHVPRQHEKRLCFWRTQMPVRTDVRARQERVQETMRVVLITRVEIVILTPPRRMAGLVHDGVNEPLCYKLDGCSPLHAHIVGPMQSRTLPSRAPRPVSRPRRP